MSGQRALSAPLVSPGPVLHLSIREIRFERQKGSARERASEREREGGGRGDAPPPNLNSKHRRVALFRVEPGVERGVGCPAEHRSNFVRFFSRLFLNY